MPIALIVFFALVVLTIFTTIFIYNILVTKTAMTEEAWSGVEVQLKRRYDLIPMLIETVKSYASHEDKLFSKVLSSRENCLNSQGSPSELLEKEKDFTTNLRSIFALAENYPDLKANENFKEFQKQISKLEDEIQISRRYFNGTVRELNISVQTFPGNIIANLFHFKKQDFFDVDESETVIPEIKF
ncbi:LemA family protein [Bacteriovorax sp. Seq25_V]|uniref:LemA family protein n=1 Tax=Bacteriovorax sp. Seq25_V TaxID=1201288 RepID=UPI000389E339|nr:LemA family protein [Bacteriovorax sp. Seq25_V]EQC46154.1 LemA family protein [Bacteriovorax sp. Seq25_V]